jgi:hypothetical protein
MTDDDRTTCLACANFRGGRCHQAKLAFGSPWASIEIGTTLANLPQRCPAFKERKNGR